MADKLLFQENREQYKMRRKFEGEEQKMVRFPISSSSALAEIAIGSDDEDDVWKRFKEVGSLDEESLEKKDKAALMLRLKQIESELHDYQHNMGLILMDRKDWASKYAQLELALVEMKEKLGQEKVAQLIALSNVEKRKESLRSALEAKKHYVHDLVKDLHALHAEFEEMKSKYEVELGQAYNMKVSIEKKSLAAESDLNASNKFLAEENSKHADIVRRLNEVEALEDAFWRENESFQSERESNEIRAVHERQYLHDWEKRLEEGQERLLEGQRLLHKRGYFANGRDVALEQIEKDLPIRRKQIEEEQAALHQEDAELSARLAGLRTQEENTAKREIAIKMKDHELLVLKENLTTREHVEIPRLLIRQKDELEAAKAMFEAELEQRHRSLEDELVKRRQLAELRVARVDIKEAQLLERHKQLEEKDEKLKEIEENLDAQLISLKKSEQTLESGKCEIKIEKKKLEGLREILSNAKQDVESLREVIEEEKQQIQNEREKLTIIEEENNSFQNLKMKIKEEIDDFRASKKDVINEANQIKREKESLDEDYRMLEEIKKQADKELEQANEEAESVLKWHHDEGERLKKEKRILTEQVEMNAEALHVETEAFIGNLEHERAEWFAKLEKEHNDLVQDFELQRNELARSTMERHKGIERWLQEKELEFQKKKQREVRCIYALKELAHMEVEESRLARERLEKGRQGINKLRKQTEMGWSEIKKGVNELQIQRQKLKQQRELLQKEKEETLRDFKQLQKLKNDFEVSEYSLMLSEQEASQESVNEGEFIHEVSQGKHCGRTGSFLVSPCHLSLLHNHVSFANKSKSNIWFEKDATAELMQDDIEHVIPFHDVGDDHVQNIKANVACPLSTVAEDTKLVLESYPYKECNPSAVTWEVRRNVVGMVCDKDNSCIVGENLVHNRMNSVIEGDGSQDSLVLQVNQQEADRKGNSGKKRSHRYSTGTSEPNLFQSEIESEVSTGGPRKRLQRIIVDVAKH